MRPRSIAEIAERAAVGDYGDFDRAWREFLDWRQSASAEELADALAVEPARLDPVKDAWLAALTEHLALSARIDVPEWSEKDARFLKEPFFAGCLELLKATFLVESPLAFRRRLIFISADALSRPRREFAEGPA